MQLLALLLIIAVAGTVAMLGILPPDQVQALIVPAGAVILLAAGVALALRAWLATRAAWRTGKQVAQRVREGMKEPVRYGVPPPAHPPSGPEHRRGG